MAIGLLTIAVVLPVTLRCIARNRRAREAATGAILFGTGLMIFGLIALRIDGLLEQSLTGLVVMSLAAFSLVVAGSYAMNGRFRLMLTLRFWRQRDRRSSHARR